MKIITADETGLIKAVRIENGEVLAIGAGEQARAHAVRALCYPLIASSSSSAPSTCRSQFFALRSAGIVDLWQNKNFRPHAKKTSECTLSRRGAFTCPADCVALCFITCSASADQPHRVMTCEREGHVQIGEVPETDESVEAKQFTNFTISGPVSTAIASGVGGSPAVAAGGQENDLKIWNIDTQQCTWRAKNFPHDNLELRQPVWISSLQQLTPDEGLRELVSGTAYRQVRLYDIRAQRRPTSTVDADEHPITTMAVVPGSREVIVADTAGLVRALDVRTMRWGRRFSGPGGSVRGIALHPTLPVLTCVGLDRMARVYDLTTAKQTFQIYLKQRLNAVLFDEEGEVKLPSQKAKGGADGTEINNASGVESDGWESGEEYEMGDGSSEDEDEDSDSHEYRNAMGGNAQTLDRRSTAGDGEGTNMSQSSQESEYDEDEDNANGDDDQSGGEADGQSESHAYMANGNDVAAGEMSDSSEDYDDGSDAQDELAVSEPGEDEHVQHRSKRQESRNKVPVKSSKKRRH